jgi:16S rRNA (cytosine1402-N4)-methyltransferase
VVSVNEHVPVLLEESLDFLQPERGGVYVDVTVGLGGHASRLLERAPSASLVGLDRDPEALELAARRLHPFGDRVRLVRSDYRRVREALAEVGHATVAGILGDLGVSSLQLERASRGFSFRREGPLDMRMGPDAARTARDVVNQYSEGELVRLLKDYGEERQARRIARAIVRERERAPLETTVELRDLIHRTVGLPPPHTRHRLGGIDSATRTFQALRIEVNQELEGLETFLEQAISLLERDGRLVVISYQSLEDRLVKCALRQAALGEVDPVTGRKRAETRLIELLTRKPVRATEAEVLANPRSRSARLRAARRI